jgi:hypothetical protein
MVGKVKMALALDAIVPPTQQPFKVGAIWKEKSYTSKLPGSST